MGVLTGRVLEVLGQGYLAGVVLPVPGAEKRHVRLEEVDVQHEGTLAVATDEPGRLIRQVCRAAQFFRQSGCLATAEGAVVGRPDAALAEPVVIRAPGVAIPPRAEELRVRVLYAPPLIKAVLGENLIAQERVS